MKNWNALYSSVLDNLKKQLSPFLMYHRWKHTQHVLEQAEQIALHEHITEDELLLLKTAALFHDAGFINGFYEGHEEEGVRMVENILPEYGYSKTEIEIIAGMIRATIIPQKPKTKLECILADADLEYLGTDKFEHLGNILYLELRHFHPNLSLDEWNEMQINFLQSHVYHTAYCIQRRAPLKQENLNRLIKKRKKQEKIQTQSRK